MWSWSSERLPPKRTAIVTQSYDLSPTGLGQVLVVDQSRFPDPDRQYSEASRRAESGRVDHVGVVDRGERLGLQPRQHDRPKAVRIPLPSLLRLGCQA